MNEIVHTSVRIKGAVVAEDPTEQGLRKNLNFGHTIGHAVESYYLEKENFLLHGEAVVVGMIAEAYLSFQYGELREASLEEIIAFLKTYYEFPKVEESGIDLMLDYMKMDKKNEEGSIQYVQLRSIGEQNNILTLPIIEGQQPTDICQRAISAANLNGAEIILFDTAGRTH